MKMDDMNKILEEMGFIVCRNYIAENTVYSFTISKNGNDRMTSYFKYPKDAAPIEKDRLQRDFIEDITHKYYVSYELHSLLTTTMSTVTSTVSIPAIKKVIFNYPATIILLADGTKTVVKCDGDNYDPEKGMAMAIAKKALGNKGNYYNKFKKWLPVPKPISGFEDVIEAFKKLGEDFKKFNIRKKDS